MQIFHLGWMLCLLGGAQAETPGDDGELALLAQWMTGASSSEAQAEEDESYYHISLIMAPIWRHRTDGYWFYVEQAVAASLEKPYRQRVYHVRRGEGGALESAVFAMSEPLRYAGAWKEKHPLSELGPADLIPREGCTVVLRKEGDRFLGGTENKDCSSQLRGASYATAEIVIYADRLMSWDRGFDANGEQVWGAEKGAYIFTKKSTDLR